MLGALPAVAVNGSHSREHPAQQPEQSEQPSPELRRATRNAQVLEGMRGRAMEKNLHKHLDGHLQGKFKGQWMEDATPNLKKLLVKLDKNHEGHLDGRELKQVETLYGGLSDDCTEFFGGRRNKGFFNPEVTHSARDADGRLPLPPPPRQPQPPADEPLSVFDALSGQSLAANPANRDYSIARMCVNEPGVAGRMVKDRIRRPHSPSSSAGYTSRRCSERQRAVQDEASAERRGMQIHASPRQMEARRKVTALEAELEELRPRFNSDVNPPVGKRIGMPADGLRSVELPRRQDKRSFLQSSEHHGLVYGGGYHRRSEGWKAPIAVGRRAHAMDRFKEPAAGAQLQPFKDHFEKQTFIYQRK